MLSGLYTRLASRALLASSTLLLFCLLVLYFTAQPAAVAGCRSGSIGLTGNLSQLEFSLVPGTSIEPTNSSVVVINSRATEQHLSLQVESPEGVKVELNQPRQLTVEPLGRVRIAVRRITAAQHVPPGTYPLTLRVYSANSKEDGDGALPQPGTLRIIPGTGMTAKLRVAGKAGLLKLRPTDLAGKPIAAKVEVAYGSGDSWTPLFSATGEVSHHVAPGRYRVQARLGQRIVAAKTAEVEAGQEVAVELPVKTISFVNFAAVPQRRGGRISYYELPYDLQNRLEKLSSTTVQLRVYRSSTEVFRAEHTLPQLPHGITGGAFAYTPDTQAEGFGPRHLQLVLLRKGEVLTKSKKLILEVAPQSFLERTHFALAALGALTAKVSFWPVLVVAAVVLFMLGLVPRWQKEVIDGR